MLRRQFVRTFVLGATAILLGCASAQNQPPSAGVWSLYFGHPYGMYGTDLERRLEKSIAEAFPGWRVENPNQPHHERGYEKWKAATGQGMNYYFRVVLPKMHGGVFLPYRDGAWGAGVYDEALHLFEQRRPIWAITHEGAISRTTPEEMRLTGGVLSIVQTKARNAAPY